MSSAKARARGSGARATDPAGADGGRAPGAGPGCCELGAANLRWFPRSGVHGAWHARSFAWDPRRDAPPTDAYACCPFCGARLVDSDGGAS